MKKTKQPKKMPANIPSSTKPEGDELSLHSLPGETEEIAGARGILNPVVGAVLTIKRQPAVLASMLNINAAINELETQCKAVSDGNMARGESMLVAQSHTLDALFNHLAVLAARSLQTNANQGEMLYRLAFKAQAQCRASVEALAEIKHPRSVSFVKQANIAAGNQQINNGITQNMPLGSRTEENEITPNKLLKNISNETLDTRGALTPSNANSPMETVEAFNGSKDKEG